MTDTPDPQLANRLSKLFDGDPAAMSRIISAIENEAPQARTILKAIQSHLGGATVVGFTGPPGAGKSTLINAFIGVARKRDQSVGVVAVDPSSPITGGAILGDRIRMAEHSSDPQVFVRSLASRGHLGGLSRTASRVIDVMDAAGKDLILTETVGTGQSEVEIAEVAGTKVVICAPGLGDDIQAIKAGILEIADILVVNKGDMPLAPHTVRQLQGMLHLRPASATPVPIITTVATTGEGLDQLFDAVQAHAAQNRSAGQAADPRQRISRLLAEVVAQHAKDRMRQLKNDPALDAVCEQVQTGEIDFDHAAEMVLRLLVSSPKPDGSG